MANKGLLILGLLLAVSGLVFIYYGNEANNDIEMKLHSIIRGGPENPGTMVIVIGAVVLAFGVLLIYGGVTPDKKRATHVDIDPLDDGYVPIEYATIHF